MHRINRENSTRSDYTFFLLLVLIGLTLVVLLTLRFSWADKTSSARVYIDPPRVTVNEGLFTLSVMVESHIPVNTFAGELHFDPSIVTVDVINYGSSIANLWVNAPTYENTTGTIYFVGGTTEAGGFVGSGTLFTVTFRAHRAAVTTVGFTKAEMLQSDGYGTPAELARLTDAIVTISPKPAILNQPPLHSSQEEDAGVTDEAPVTSDFDLNHDNEISFSDIGVFLEFLRTRNLLADFDKDGTVTERDMDILLEHI
ncbi:MAG: cohesin domain-containing protein [Patescibacteria group bacterium]